MRYFSFSFYWFQFANILSRISASMSSCDFPFWWCPYLVFVSRFCQSHTTSWDVLLSFLFSEITYVRPVLLLKGLWDLTRITTCRHSTEHVLRPALREDPSSGPSLLHAVPGHLSGHPQGFSRRGVCLHTVWPSQAFPPRGTLHSLLGNRTAVSCWLPCASLSPPCHWPQRSPCFRSLVLSWHFPSLSAVFSCHCTLAGWSSLLTSQTPARQTLLLATSDDTSAKPSHLLSPLTRRRWEGTFFLFYRKASAVP